MSPALSAQRPYGIVRCSPLPDETFATLAALGRRFATLTTPQAVGLSAHRLPACGVHPARQAISVRTQDEAGEPIDWLGYAVCHTGPLTVPALAAAIDAVRGVRPARQAA